MTAEIVNNGSRVELPFAIGPAGLVERCGTTMLSYFPGKGPFPRVGGALTIEDVAYDVVAVAPSKAVKPMVVATLVRQSND